MAEAKNPTVDELEKKEEELFRTGPLSVLTTSVKSNSQVLINCRSVPVSPEQLPQGSLQRQHCRSSCRCQWHCIFMMLGLVLNFVHLSVQNDISFLKAILQLRRWSGCGARFGTNATSCVRAFLKLAQIVVAPAEGWCFISHIALGMNTNLEEGGQLAAVHYCILWTAATGSICRVDCTGHCW